MSRTTTRGYRRIKPTKNSTPAVLQAVAQITFNPTAASADTGVILPKGAIPQYVINVDGGATGGSSPTVDVGTAAKDDGFAAELPADAVSIPVVANATLLGVELTADTAIYAGVGASAATGGTVRAAIYYLMPDDGKA